MDSIGLSKSAPLKRVIETKQTHSRSPLFVHFLLVLVVSPSS